MKRRTVDHLFIFIIVIAVLNAIAAACGPAVVTPQGSASPQSLNVTVWDDPDPNVNVRCYHYGEWSCVNLGPPSTAVDGAIPTLPPP